MYYNVAYSLCVYICMLLFLLMVMIMIMIMIIIISSSSSTSSSSSITTGKWWFKHAVTVYVQQMASLKHKARAENKTREIKY